MALEQPGFMVGFLLAAADLSAKQFLAVKVDNTGKIAVAGAGDHAIGVLQDTPASGEPGCVMLDGVTKMVAGGAITAGDLIAADANGKAKVAVKGRTDTSDAGGAVDALLGSNVLGIALTAAAADGEIITLALGRAGSVPTTAS